MYNGLKNQANRPKLKHQTKDDKKIESQNTNHTPNLINIDNNASHQYEFNTNNKKPDNIDNNGSDGSERNNTNTTNNSAKVEILKQYSSGELIEEKSPPKYDIIFKEVKETGHYIIVA